MTMTLIQILDTSIAVIAGGTLTYLGYTLVKIFLGILPTIKEVLDEGDDEE